MVFVIQVTYFTVCFFIYNVARLDRVTSKCPLALGICGSMTKSAITKQIGKERPCGCQKHKGYRAAPNALAQLKAWASPARGQRARGETLLHLGTEWEVPTSEVTILPNNPCPQTCCFSNPDHQKIGWAWVSQLMVLSRTSEVTNPKLLPYAFLVNSFPASVWRKFVPFLKSFDY